jgi:hypothetical protein
MMMKTVKIRALVMVDFALAFDFGFAFVKSQGRGSKLKAKNP